MVTVHHVDLTLGVARGAVVRSEADHAGVLSPHRQTEGEGA